MKENWSKVSWKLIKKKNFYESNLLKLNSKKANKKLGWQTILTFDETIKMISEWYKVYYSSKKNLAAQMTLKQIKYYEILLKKRTKII
jgi:CDP-glucose 4,6-dehydratase